MINTTNTNNDETSNKTTTPQISLPNVAYGRACRHCQRDDCALLRCAQCKAAGAPDAFYCSQQCQQNDWTVHRVICGSTEREYSKLYFEGSLSNDSSMLFAFDDEESPVHSSDAIQINDNDKNGARHDIFLFSNVTTNNNNNNQRRSRTKSQRERLTGHKRSRSPERSFNLELPAPAPPVSMFSWPTSTLSNRSSSFASLFDASDSLFEIDAKRRKTGDSVLFASNGVNDDTLLLSESTDQLLHSSDNSDNDDGSDQSIAERYVDSELQKLSIPTPPPLPAWYQRAKQQCKQQYNNDNNDNENNTNINSNDDDDDERSVVDCQDLQFPGDTAAANVDAMLTTIVAVVEQRDVKPSASESEETSISPTHASSRRIVHRRTKSGGSVQAIISHNRRRSNDKKAIRRRKQRTANPSTVGPVKRSRESKAKRVKRAQYAKLSPADQHVLQSLGVAKIDALTTTFGRVVQQVTYLHTRRQHIVQWLASSELFPLMSWDYENIDSHGQPTIRLHVARADVHSALKILLKCEPTEWMYKRFQNATTSEGRWQFKRGQYAVFLQHAEKAVRT